MSSQPLLDSSTASTQIVSICFETGGARRLCIVRRDGSCSWKADGIVWRPASLDKYGPVLSACWRPFSSKRSILALGFDDAVIFCDAPSELEKGGLRPSKEVKVEISGSAQMMAWAQRGRVLCVASSDSCYVTTIDAALGCIDGSFRPVGFRNQICSFSWSPNNKLFASGTILPVFRVCTELMEVVETWTSSSAVTFGAWSKDGNRFLCGSMADGVVLVDLISKQQWVIISPELLHTAIDEAREAVEQPDEDIAQTKIRQICWEPLRNDLIVVVLENPNSAAVYKTSQLGKLMSCAYVTHLPAQRSKAPVQIEFDAGGKGVAVAYSDSTVDLMPALL